VQRYGQNFAKQLGAVKTATDQVRAMVAETADEAGAMSDALTRLTQQKIFDLLVDLDAVEIDESKLANLAKGVAALTRATVTQRQWAMKVRQTLDKQKSAASERIDEVAKGGGLTPEAAQIIRNALLEINPL
jgi:Bacteriophage Mu, Gp27